MPGQCAGRGAARAASVHGAIPWARDHARATHLLSSEHALSAIFNVLHAVAAAAGCGGAREHLNSKLFGQHAPRRQGLLRRSSCSAAPHLGLGTGTAVRLWAARKGLRSAGVVNGAERPCRVGIFTRRRKASLCVLRASEGPRRARTQRARTSGVPQRAQRRHRPAQGELHAKGRRGSCFDHRKYQPFESLLSWHVTDISQARGPRPAA